MRIAGIKGMKFLQLTMGITEVSPSAFTPRLAQQREIPTRQSSVQNIDCRIYICVRRQSTKRAVISFAFTMRCIDNATT